MAFTRLVSTSASEDRLEKLIEQRPAARRRQARPRRPHLGLSGFSRNVAEFGIIHFLQVSHESRKVLIPIIEDHDGILLKTEGDSMMIIFRNPGKAIECAVEIQAACRAYNKTRVDSEKLLLCVGIGMGQVARGWEILVSEQLRNAVSGHEFEPLDSAPAGTSGAYRLRYSL